MKPSYGGGSRSEAAMGQPEIIFPETAMDQPGIIFPEAAMDQPGIVFCDFH
jgi:hypothetical protein